jgi:fido (protein-threonine AMPylation protein)
MEFTYQPWQTPLDPDEKEGLKPKHISIQSELNEWEQLNIIRSARWAQRQLRQEIMDDMFLRELHKRMFGDTWKWAGTYRRSDKNIGCDWRQVSMRVRQLLENTRYQVEQQAVPPDELAALRAADQGDIAQLLAFARK